VQFWVERRGGASHGDRNMQVSNAWLRLRASLVLMLTAVIAVVFLFSVASARADGPNAVEGLPGCMANSLAANDDGSTNDVPLGFSLNFGNTDYSTVFVNNNGNVTFDGALSDYTPFDFTTAGNVIIAPFLADVDTRDPNPGGDTPPNTVTYGTGTEADGTNYFCVDWINVGYYAEHDDLTNSFQLLLTQSPAQAAAGNSFSITFNYDRIDWETGDASGGSNGLGGTSAAAGYASGDGNQDDVLPGSFTNGALLDSNPTTGLVNGELNSGGQAGRYVFDVPNETTSGGTVDGEVYESDGTSPETQAPVDLCPTGGGACVTRSTNSSGIFRTTGLAAGTYTLTAYPNSGDDEGNGTAGPITVTTGQTTTQNITLSAAPQAPPDGTTFTGYGNNDQGIPVINWEEPGTLSTEACAGAQLNWTMTADGAAIAGGPMTQTGAGDPNTGSATYQAPYPAVSPHHGLAQVTITGTCPQGGDAIDDAFGVYIDPSGTIVNTAGDPIPNATVTLLRSDSPSGPFVQIPDDSAEMSPANRSNPSITGTDGSFGWDVVSGYYEIQATADGCFSNQDHTNPVATSAVLQVPPPATGLKVTMWCGEATPPPVTTTTAPPTTTPTTATPTTATPTTATPTTATPTTTAPATPGSHTVSAATVSATAASALTSQFQSLLGQLKKGLGKPGVKAFSISQTFPEPGALVLTVSATASSKPATQHQAHARNGKAKTVKVATARATVTAPGSVPAKIRLTTVGRRLLAQTAKQHGKLKLAVSESFAPTYDGQALSPITPAGSFSIAPAKAKASHTKKK